LSDKAGKPWKLARRNAQPNAGAQRARAANAETSLAALKQAGETSNGVKRRNEEARRQMRDKSCLKQKRVSAA
jgi:hypothetical protein